MSQFGNNAASHTKKPPLWGSFPLDHEGECRQWVHRILECYRTHKGNQSVCRREVKEYLECRMQKGLMKRESWSDLGFHGFDEASDANGGTARGDNNVSNSS